MNWFADLGMHLTSGGIPLNGIAQNDKAGCQTTCFSHRIGRNIWQRIFVFKLHVDISSGFTFKVSGACALREQVSQFCNICVLSRQTDAASRGLHPEGVTINSSWNDVKWNVNSKFSNIKSGKKINENFENLIAQVFRHKYEEQVYQISKLSTVHGQILRHLKNVWQPYRQPHRHRSPPILLSFVSRS